MFRASSRASCAWTCARVSPDAVLRTALDAVRPTAASRSIRLECVLDPPAGPITGHPDRWQQVFWNLPSNAIKFTLQALSAM